MMWKHSREAMDHFLRPRNVGELQGADAVGQVGSVTGGDALKLYLRMDDDKARVARATFQTFGCASAIASASALTELVRGCTVAELKTISRATLSDYLGILPEERAQGSVKVLDALQDAIAQLESGGGAQGSVTPAEEPSEAGAANKTICFCFGVSERTIREVIRRRHLTTADDVTEACKAGGGCGGCRPDIQRILREEKDRPDASG